MNMNWRAIMHHAPPDHRGDGLAPHPCPGAVPARGRPRRRRGGILTFKASTPTRTKRTRRSSGPISSRDARRRTSRAADLAALAKQRQALAAKIAGGIGGAETGAGPTHWYEHLQGSGSRPWLIVDPPDGKLPAMTPQALKREAAAAALNDARNGEGRADSWLDRSLYDRCITRGLPGSMMPAIYGNAYEIVQTPDCGRDPLRDDSRDADHPARRPSACRRERSASTSATRAAAGTATRSSSRRRTSPTGRTSATTTASTASSSR